MNVLDQFFMVYGKPDFLIVFWMPFVVFAVLLLLFSNAFMQLPSVCCILSALAAAGSIFLIVIRNRGHVWFPLGVACLLATGLGTLSGFYVYDQYACFPLFYANSRIYSNVVPSQPSGAVADAGKITFSSETAVDANHSVGYINEKGRIYCVAPVRDKSGSTLIQFWAVGLDCCDSTGGFACDQAADQSAGAGVRVFDNSGFFYDSRKDFYIKARRKAEASFGLVSADAPMYIRWVRQDNLDMLSKEYSGKAVAVLVLFLVLGAVGSALLAFATYTPRRPTTGPLALEK